MSTVRLSLSPSALLLTMSLLLAPIGSAVAAIYCVDSPLSLEQAIETVGHDSDAANEIRIVVGVYDVAGSNLTMSEDARNDLVLSGGWAAGCAARANDDVRETRLVGAINESFVLSGRHRIEMHALTLSKFALVRTRRNGDEGGYAIVWDAVRFTQIGKIDALSESAGAIDLRNLLVHDSGLAAGDCLLSIEQEIDDGLSTSLLAQSTFALNAGSKQVCLSGVETSKLLRNNIFDGDSMQFSAFVENTAATFQNNRIQILGGLPASADSIDNFNTAAAFVNVAARDFRLAAGSPAINRGYMALPEGQRAFDAFGKERWNGFRPDLGALETGTIESSLFTVTNANDSGPGSLRQAVIDANSHFNPSIIQFDMPNGCNSRILLNSELPAVIAPLWVDGYSQPGSARNSSDSSFNATICVGVVAGQFGFAHAFRTESPGAPMRIEGVAFSGFGAASGSNAVLVINEARESVIRGNQFGGSSGFGMLVPSNADVSIAGAAIDVQVGGPDTHERNLFASTLNAPNIGIAGLVRNAQVLGNWFGLDRDGVMHLGTDTAVLIEGKSALVRDNLFAYGEIGVVFGSSFAEFNRVQNNRFGLDGLGENAELRTAVSSRGGKRNVIGAGADQISGGNEIANCTGPAIEIIATQQTPIGTRVRANRIRATATGMDIDLANVGPTVNDAGDLDDGPNRRMNHPVLAVVSDAQAMMSISGNIDTLPGNVLIDFYASAAPRAGGRGEAAQYLGHSVASNGSFLFQMPLNINNPYPFISATATNGDGDTSELSPSLRAPPLFVDGVE